MNNKIRVVLSLFCLVFSVNTMFAQDTIKEQKTTVMLSSRLHYGFIIPHHESFKFLIEKHVTAFDVIIAFPTSGKKCWEQLYKKPSLGFGYYYGNFGNPEILGSVHSLYIYYKANFFTVKNFTLNHNLAFGLAYMTKPFDYQTNYLNFAIGTNINLHVNLNLETEYKINNKLTIFSDIGITHFSNGAVKMPNRGINIISISTGAKYFFNNEKKNIPEKAIPEFNGYNDFRFFITGGLKGIYPCYSKQYPISVIFANFGRTVSYKSRIGLGVNLFYNGSLVKKYETDSVFNSQKKDYLYSGVYFSYDIIFGKISFTIHQGFYLTQKNIDYKIYQRFGFRYNFNNNISANLSIVTYFANAQFVEWGIGYNLRKNKTYN